MISKYISDNFLKGMDSPSLRFSKCIDKNDSTDNKRSEIDALKEAMKKAPVTFQFISLDATPLVLELGGRLIINQAGGVLENAGLLLHRTCGWPYIPGSAIKGCCRHRAWERWYAEQNPEKKRELARKIAFQFGYPTLDAYSDKATGERFYPEEYLDNYLSQEFPEDFGANGKYSHLSGSVAFLDAFPQKHPIIVTEIVNCHHPEYYNGKPGKALDTEAPNPQLFPAVEKGCRFSFQLYALSPKADLKWVREILEEALKLNGIGAKTSAGYGWFQEPVLTEAEILQAKTKAEAMEAEEKRKAKVREADEKRKNEEERKLHLAEQLKSQEEAEQQRQITEAKTRDFMPLADKKWAVMRSTIDNTFKTLLNFERNQQQNLHDALQKSLDNKKVKFKDLEGASKSLDKWFAGADDLRQDFPRKQEKQE